MPTAALTIRPLREADRAAYVRAVDALSDRTRMLRFHAPKRTLTPREVDRLLDVGHDGAEALAAFGADGEIAAVARYAPLPGEPGTADVAIVVGDPWQGQGLGDALLTRLVAGAWAAGHTRLRATTLAGNDAVHGLLRRHGFRPLRTSQGVQDWEARR